jgi:hypothetical protein
VLSIAGVNRALDRISRQVAESSALDPLERLIVQAVTRPLAPTSRLKLTAPCSPRRSEAG